MVTYDATTQNILLLKQIFYELTLFLIRHTLYIGLGLVDLDFLCLLVTIRNSSFDLG